MTSTNNSERIISFKSKDYINYKRLQIIIDNWDKMPKFITESYDGYFMGYLKNYLKKVKKIDDELGTVNIIYKYSQIKKNSGRQYVAGSLGLQSMARQIRHTLTHDILYDIDIVNAHFNILLQYCKKNKGYPYEQIEKSVEYNDEYKQDLINKGMSLDDAKKFKLSIIYGSKKTIDLNWFEMLKKEIEQIHELMYNEQTNEKKIKQIEDDTEYKECNVLGISNKKKIYNLKGRLCGSIMCEIENEILVSCLEFFKIKKIPLKEVSLCFDGFMIRKDILDLYAIDVMIDQMKQYVEKKTGYEMKFIIKPQKESIDLTGMEVKKYLIVDNDIEARDIILKEMENEIFSCSGDVYVKSIEMNTWTNKPDRVKRRIHQACEKKDIKIQSSRGQIISYSKNMVGIKAIEQLVKDDCPINDNLVEEIRLISLYKIFFANGVYDFKEGLFRQDGDDEKTVIRIKHNYPKEEDEESNKFIYLILNSLFETNPSNEKLGPCAKNMIQHIARGLAGHIEDKDYVITTGFRNSGKGVLTLLCILAFESYATECDGNNFLLNGNRSSDLAKNNMWLIHHIWSRLLLSNECNINDTKHETSIINGVILKSLLSGGDTQKARDLYKSEINFIFGGRLFLFVNDLPEIKPADTYQQLTSFHLSNKFMPEVEYERLKKKGKLEPFMKKANPNIKQILTDNRKYIDAFIRIVIKNYKTTRVINIRNVRSIAEGYIDESHDDIYFFKKMFDFSNEKEFTPSQDVISFVKQYYSNMTPQKALNFLSKNMNLKNARKIVKGSKLRGFEGVKLIIPENKKDDDDDVPEIANISPFSFFI